MLHALPGLNMAVRPGVGSLGKANPTDPGQPLGPHLDAICWVYGATGALGGALTDVPWYVALLLSITYEVAERIVKSAAPDVMVWPRQDTLRDSAIEVGSTMIGFGLGRALRRS